MEIENNAKWNVSYDFVDIIFDRRGKSDVAWASRRWNSAIAYRQSKRISGEEVKLMVLQSPYLKHVIEEINRKTHVPVPELYKNAMKILEEIGYYRNLSVIRWFGVFIAKALKKLYLGVFVNETKFLKIKSCMGYNPVLFLPSHKSYCDFILMAYICFHYDVDIPRIAAGIDFLSMTVIGSLLRDSCAFFMRRSFSDDELYFSIFSEYVQTLVTKGDAAIEFFIEGTRSRTLKSLPPKFGLLSMALKPFFFGLVPDITIIPVNLSYDRILEEVLFGYELLGIPKPKESTKGLFKAMSILNENYGNVYVNFGDSISVKEYFGSELDRSLHNVGPVHRQKLTPRENIKIVQLAHTVIAKQKELTVLNCFNLIALILNNNIVSLKPLTIDELTFEVKWIFSVLKIIVDKNAVMAMNDITKETILHHLTIHKNLIFLSSNGALYLSKIFSSSSYIGQDQLKKHTLSLNTLDIAISAIILQNYVNPVAHFIVGICFLALIVILKDKNVSIARAQLFDEFKFLCSVFSLEFVLHESNTQKEFDQAMSYSQVLEIIHEDNNSIKRGKNEKLQLFCINYLNSFFPGYIIVAEILLEFPADIFLKGELLAASQKKIEFDLMNIHPSNLSLNLLKNAVHAFVIMGAVNKVKGNPLKYTVNKLKIKEIYLKLKSYDTRKNCRGQVPFQFSGFIKSAL